MRQPLYLEQDASQSVAKPLLTTNEVILKHCNGHGTIFITELETLQCQH